MNRFCCITRETPSQPNERMDLAVLLKRQPPNSILQGSALGYAETIPASSVSSGFGPPHFQPLLDGPYSQSVCRSLQRKESAGPSHRTEESSPSEIPFETPTFLKGAWIVRRCGEGQADEAMRTTLWDQETPALLSAPLQHPPARAAGHPFAESVAALSPAQ